MTFQRIISKPDSLAKAKEELHGMIVRAGYRPIESITALWQTNLFDENDDALVFVKVTKR